MTAPGGGQENRNANVVLTADAGQYQQQMAASAQSTNKLSLAVQNLATHLDGLSKRAGKRLLQFSAADFAALGGATATAASFEKQLGTLRATAALTNQSFKQMKGGIENTFTSFPVNRNQVIQLTEAITNLGVTGVKNISSLTQTFTKLSAATGEDAVGLAQGLTQLSRLMGVTNSQQIGNFANSLLMVSKNAGVSATGVLNFAQAIAPMARQAGIGEAAVLGISTAFSKAGADGYVAANTFNSMVSDITNLVQVGSPDLQKYARLIGTTAEQFAKMDKTTALTQIFEAINRQGPRAIQTLNQLGFEGIRAQAAISAVVQSGGLRQAVAQATGSANDQNGLNRGARTAMQGLTDELIKLRSNFTQLGTEIGTTFLTPMAKVIEVFNHMFSILNQVIKPFAPIIAAVGAFAGALGGLGAAALLTFAAVSKLSLLAGAVRPLLAFRGGVAVGRDATATNAYAERQAAGQLGFFSANAFRAGSGVGSILGPPGTPTPGAGGAGRQLGFFGLRAPFLAGRGLVNAQTEFLRETANLPPVSGAGTVLSVARARGVAGAAGAAVTDDATKSMSALAKAQAAATKVVQSNAAATAAAGSASQLVANESRATAAAIFNLGRQSLATGATMVGRGIGAGAGLLARGAGGLLSSPLGIIGLSMFAPQIFSGIGNLFGAHSQDRYLSAGAGNNITKYDTLLGQTSNNLATFGTAVNAATDKLKNLAGQPISQVTRITPSDVSAAGGGYKITDKTFAAFKGGGQAGINAGVSYIQSLAAQHGGLDAQYLQSIKTDLIAQVGPQRAQQIIDSYARTSTAGGGAPVINYGQFGAFGRGLTGANYQNLSSQVFSSIQSQSQLNTGRASSQAGLNAILSFSTSLAGPNRGNAATQFGNELNKMFGTDYFKNYGFNFTNRSLSTSQAQNILLRDLLIASATNPQIRNQLTSAGVDVNALYKRFNSASILNSNLVGPAVRSQLGGNTIFGNPLSPGSTETRVLNRSALGQYITGSSSLQSVIGTGPNVGNPAAQARAQQDLLATAVRLNGGLDGAATALRHLADTASQQADPALQALANAAAQQARQHFEGTVLPTYTRGQQTQYLVGRVAETRRQYQATGTDEARTEFQNAQQQLDQQQEANRQFVLQMYQTVRNYNIQTQRSYEDYQKQVYRSNRDFHIQMLQSEQDFQRQRYRMTRDFNIQLEQQAVQSAQSIYNPFQRVYDQQTADAGTVLQNLQDQNQRIQQQFAQLQQLRRMGVSQQTIDVLNLADPNNAQQLNSLIQGVTNNPSMVRAINAAVNQRQRATTQLTQSDFNITFRQTVDAFHRSFNDMTTDYNISRQRAEDAQKRGLDDLAVDYQTMLDRSLQDMNTAVTEISGTMEDLMKKTFRELGKSISTYAPEYANTIQSALDSINLPGAGGSGGSEGGSLGPRGSSSNPITTPNTLGINPSGQIGTYDKSGKFHPYQGYVSPSQAQALQKIHIAANNANTPSGAQAFARSLLGSYGWSASQMQPLIYLWNQESGWRWNAENPSSGAYGIPQSLPASKMSSAGSDWRTNGATQIKWGLAYIKGRYGSPAGAWAHEQANNWYDQGGVLKPGITRAINATGKPEFILTPEQLKAVNTAGLGSQTMNVHKTYIDNSMTFKDITVVAQDPNAMAKALKAKARLAKLVSPPRSALQLG